MPSWSIDDRSDFTDRLPTLDLPALVIPGEVDPLSPARVGEFVRDRLPSATLSVVAGGTHAMAFEEPDRIAPLIERFLRG